MRRSLRHRIRLLVSLAALALIVVTAVTLLLGRVNEEQLSRIETRYVPLLELDRDLKTIFAKVPRALEDAASAADETELHDADALEAELVRRLAAGGRTIANNGGDPAALSVELQRYYRNAREVSSSIVDGVPAGQLGPQIEQMHRAQQMFTAHLDVATSPDRRRLAAAIATARGLQSTSLRVDIVVAVVVLGAMALMSWRIVRRATSALHAVGVGVERIARGDFGHAIEVAAGDEFGELAREANRMADRLRAYRQQQEREAWIKTGLAELGDHIAGSLDPVALGTRAMRYLAGYVGARGAIVYASDDSGFRQLGVDGLGDAAPPDDFRLAAGAIELAARDGDIHVEQAATGCVVVVPLLHDSRAMGALELAMAAPPDDRAIELLTRIRGVLGIALFAAASHQRAQALLAETQQHAAAIELVNKELETFSYSVSHDLRAPLRSIDAFSQMLLEEHADQLPAAGQDHLRRIRSAAHRMAELIESLLQLSRVSRSDVRREPVDLSALFAAIVDDLRRDDRQRQIDVHVQGNVTALADPRLIRITLQNLVGNAWKFTSKTPAAMIEFGARQEAGDHVYYVRDNGAGFDMSYVSRLFGAFQRLHTDSDFPGTGIGLATVQRIIMRHGGRIWVDAAVARGANFQFTLPTPDDR